MKKYLPGILLVIGVVGLIIYIVSGYTIKFERKDYQTIAYNQKFEKYVEGEVNGLDVSSVINMAVENNLNYEIKVDEDGYYVPDNKNSTKIFIYLSGSEEEFAMEDFIEVGLEDFNNAYSDAKFECTDIQYHKKTGRVSQMIFVQSEESERNSAY
ncbi:MAG: hypothetical protein IKN74_02555 [Clostridia bacterium]|nr:hypothetical protein [Clostridia bacterium]